MAAHFARAVHWVRVLTIFGVHLAPSVLACTLLLLHQLLHLLLHLLYDPEQLHWIHWLASIVGVVCSAPMRNYSFLEQNEEERASVAGDQSRYYT